MTKEKKQAIKDILVRAGKTFVQAFIASISIDSIFGITDIKVLEKIALSILVGAVASGISAVWNSFIEWLSVRIDELDDEDEEAIEEGDVDG